ncbi:MAG: SDR family NAD(P)-dependent oxidoreductase [Tannerellaceae bacterium]|jgi:NADP-dependent 3-hydroxy acid dehydrogenase YdfG|nr:SDR family NAD(P)-dependent oxidoreductase [Tannerellaceae bacterium]
MKKTALITGATSGIGRAIAERFAREGLRLVIAGRREERLLELEKELRTAFGVDILVLSFDVRQRSDVEEQLMSLPVEWEDIDILVNNAGLAAGLAPLHEGDPDDWERMIDTNIKGLLYVTRCISPRMTVRRSGHIINMGSIAGKEVYVNGNVYCATKHAVDALTLAMRMEMAEYGVKVTQICPGAVNTEFSLVRFKGDKARADKVYEGFEPLSAADIADTVWYAVAAPAHVNIQDVLAMPKAQSSAVSIYRKKS